MTGKYVYKNISDQQQVLIGYGTVEAGETIESETPIENSNFELVTKSDKKVGVVPVTEPKADEE